MKKSIETNVHEQMTLNLKSDQNLVNNKQNIDLISGVKAMKLLEFSRHKFEKAIKDGVISVIITDNKKKYSYSELNQFKQTQIYHDMVNGTVDPRNLLNDLTGKDWLPGTKSFFYQKGLGANHIEAQIEKLHPAPFSFQDISQLILFFTKAGMRVLDPVSYTHL